MKQNIIYLKNEITLSEMTEQIKPASLMLKEYEEVLKKWQKSVNLISSFSVANIWNRHILDSVQVYFKIPKTAKILVDMGSGAGFPALVIAILNQVLNGPLEQITLIESDIKKSIFLKEVVRILQLKNVIVLNERLESEKFMLVDVVTARALSSLDKLLSYAKPFMTPDTVCLFLKGKKIQEELKQVSQPITCQVYESLIDKNGYLTVIKENH